MKKSFICAVTLATLLGLAVETNGGVQASSKAVTVYQFKKAGHHVTLSGQTTTTVTHRLTKGKDVTYKGIKYYYSSQLNGYAKASAFKLFKTKHLSKAEKSHIKALHDFMKDDTPKQTKPAKQTSTPDQIVDGFDVNKKTIVDANAYSKAFGQYYLAEVNAYRTSHGANALIWNTALEPIANERGNQLLTNFTHYDSNGNIIASELESQAGINPTFMAENCAGNPIGSDGLEAPKEAAHDLLYLMWVGEVNDKGGIGGHYQNMMDTAYTTLCVGVGVEKLNDPNSRIAIAEEYTSN
ncbi:CAP domain-containing protein [Lactobacillus sp. Sy-1]|uniref:CAP domain-containing protein n=1 Tax=Lactobacillus sp. Sy-1 TaxID=2109645 RepID=UPI001C5AD638|nr:CAP domain-containing protein [Lactobacillus sp. Sy-1]MBW1606098.1 CAP domain-containing protein [Lactobacillus sp. Sy-1]